MTAAIFYHPEAYTTNRPKLMGRNAAGESFLRGYFQHANTDEFWVRTDHRQHALKFARQARALGRQERVQVVTKERLGRFSIPGVAYFPGPGLAEDAWKRALFGHDQWSLCGITHTTSSARAMDAVTSMITAPVQPWDALICTSTAVQDNVRRLLENQLRYLHDRLGIQRRILPKLPLIPLGIHTEDFRCTDQDRAEARAALGLSERQIVVLYVGRLSFHAKAHPLAMYQALEAAARQTGAKITLVECGWHANESTRQAYVEAAKLACPSVDLITLDGRVPEERQRAWRCADIFCSLSDNIQETFGLVPIEAMAAGLPVVVSDWDGYKDTVRDGVDGFRVPTTMPAAGVGRALARRHALELDTYDMYCGHSCSLIAVDIQAATQAFVQLVESPEKRQAMGAAGRARALQRYDWAAIIPLYEHLWAQLQDLRARQASRLKPLAQPWPSRPDPFQAFASYSTKQLTAESLLARVDEDADAAIARVEAYRNLRMVGFAKLVLPDTQLTSKILQTASCQPMAAHHLIDNIQPPTDGMRALAWMLKLGVLRLHQVTAALDTIAR